MSDYITQLNNRLRSCFVQAYASSVFWQLIISIKNYIEIQLRSN